MKHSRCGPLKYIWRVVIFHNIRELDLLVLGGGLIVSGNFSVMSLAERVDRGMVVEKILLLQKRILANITPYSDYSHNTMIFTFSKPHSPGTL
jgi:hypothetical protein